MLAPTLRFLPQKRCQTRSWRRRGTAPAARGGSARRWPAANGRSWRPPRSSSQVAGSADLTCALHRITRGGDATVSSCTYASAFQRQLAEQRCQRDAQSRVQLATACHTLGGGIVLGRSWGLRLYLAERKARYCWTKLKLVGGRRPRPGQRRELRHADGAGGPIRRRGRRLARRGGRRLCAQ